MSEKGWTVALIAIALASCANQAGPGVDSTEEAAEKYGACDREGVEYGSADGYVASAERWLEVVSTSPAMSSDETMAGSRTVDIEMNVRPYDTTGAGTSETVSVAIHNSMLPGVVWAMEAGGHAFLALGSKGLEREMVLYSLVESPDGHHFFTGKCPVPRPHPPTRGGAR